MYYHGWGCEKSYIKAFYAYQNAALRGSLPAMKNIAHMYAKGEGVTQSETNATYFLNKIREIEEQVSN